MDLLEAKGKSRSLHFKFPSPLEAPLKITPLELQRHTPQGLQHDHKTEHVDPISEKSRSECLLQSRNFSVLPVAFPASLFALAVNKLRLTMSCQDSNAGTHIWDSGLVFSPMRLNNLESGEVSGFRAVLGASGLHLGSLDPHQCRDRLGSRGDHGRWCRGTRRLLGRIWARRICCKFYSKVRALPVES